MSIPALPPRTRVARIAQEAVERARLSAVPRVRSRAPKVPFVSLVSLVLVSGIVGLLLFNTSMQQASFSASALETQAEALAAREQTLRMDLDQLRNQQRVAQQAQDMGMVIPLSWAFLDLETGRTIGDKVSATGADALGLGPDAPTKPAALDPAPIIVEVPAPAVENRSGKKSGTSARAKSGNKASNKTG